jgi:hypothetical protein
MQQYTIKESTEMALDHLIAQKKRSLHRGDTCAYRGDGGLKCAIGALILDENYSPELELTNAHQLEVIEALCKSGHKELAECRALAVGIQRIHDHPLACFAYHGELSRLSGVPISKFEEAEQAVLSAL